MKWLDWIFAARPLLHLPIWSVYLVSLHYHNELSGEQFGWLDLVILICASLIFSGAAYFNQVYDYETDMVNRKLGFLQRGFMDRSKMMTAFVVCCIPPLAVSALLSIFALFVFAQLYLLAFAYSAPGWRLKDRPVAGLFANAYAHGMLISILVMPDITIHNAALLDWNNPVYFFMTVAGVFALTTIPDRAGDAATGKRTLAVILGATLTTVVAILLFAGATLIAWNSGHILLASFSLVALLLTTASLVIRSEASLLMAAKMPILFLTVAAGYFYAGYFFFVVALVCGCRIYYRKRFDIAYPELA